MLYPGKAKKAYQKPVSYARRGMDLENLINEANKYYLDNGDTSAGILYT